MVLIQIDDAQVALEIHDADGTEKFDTLRVAKLYPQADVVVICFSLVNLATLESVRLRVSVWLLIRGLMGVFEVGGGGEDAHFGSTDHPGWM